MSTGIYKLNFKHGFYIGQSLNIEHRYKDHLYSMRTNIKCSKKLQDAYIQYGEPTLEILEVCTPKDLDDREQVYIDKLSACNNGYNTSKVASGGPGLSGEEHGNALYSNEDYFNILCELVNTNNTLSYIASKLKVNLAVVKSISSLQAHGWMQQEYPALYTSLTLRRGNRPTKTAGKQLKDPQGTIHTIDSLTSFCNANSLSIPKVSMVLSGKAISHKGWVLPSTNLSTALVHETYGVILVKSKVEFAKQYDLDPRRVSDLCSGKLTTHKGWRIYKLSQE